MTGYALEDFLLFSPEVYQQLLAASVSQYEPLSFLAVIALICLMIGINQPQTPRLSALLGSACCMWLGWRFYIIDYASINTFATFQGIVCLMLVPVFFFLAYNNSGKTTHLDKPLALIMIGYLCLVRPIIVFSVTEQWQFTPIGATPSPTLVLILTLFLVLRGVFYGLPIILVGLMLTVEALTLYLIGDPMWHELPMLMVLLGAFIGSRKQRIIRRPLISD